MKKKSTIIIIALVLVYVLIEQFLFVVEEGRQVVITQFGEPIGAPITEAGVHFKLPFVQDVNEFEKRTLMWDGDPNQIPTQDKKYIWVESTARWRIKDALKLMQTTVTMQRAYSRMDDIIDAVVRDVVSSNPLIEVVRSQTLQAGEKRTDRGMSGIENLTDEEYSSEIKQGREKLTRIILEKSAKSLSQFGIELIDVRLKRINYVETVRNKVYQRMISERKRIAAEYRSEGEGKKAEIIGHMEKDLQQIKSEAYKKAQIVQGQADAQATLIYGQAYNEDPEFYGFYKTLETYSQLKNNNSYLVLTTDSDLYRYLKKIQ